MRPEALYPLFSPLSSLNGIGPALVKTFGRLAIKQPVDLLWHLPTGIANFPLKSTLRSCNAGDTAAVLATILEYEIPTRGGRQPFKVVCELQDGTPFILTFFKAYPKTIETRLPRGQKRLICGTLERFQGLWQMSHPERVMPPEMATNWQENSPTYPLTAGLFQWQAQKFTQLALRRAPDLPEWLPASLSTGLPTWKEALQRVHAPQNDQDLEPTHPARMRLALDELFADQLALGLVRAYHQSGKSIPLQGTLKDQILKAFGHPLTPGQASALAEIEADMEAPLRMIRLLQGDVGAGKTLVSLLAMVQAIEAGFQTALLAPTEILASQHAKTLEKLAEKVGLEVALLTGSQKNKKATYERLEKGEIPLIVGTHALIQDAVKFANLGLVVIDEQHRFGVEQRVQLTSKGKNVDVLVMTATPIPRTLQLTTYGDLNVSRIPDKPKGRPQITTKSLNLERITEVYEGLKRALDTGNKVYWVCPLVEESEVLDLAAAEERHAHLQSLFGAETVGLIHGRQKADEKDAVMQAFKDGPHKILVATTVIEVGIDIPEATIMVIEHAERFGLSQLHQLRGRVGRGTRDSHCLLLYSHAMTEVGKRRLQVMRETNDGFLIAEEDLRLRGSGDVLGTKQSGLPSYRLVDPLLAGPLLDKAYTAAQDLLNQDPHLTSPQGKAARTLLYLFGQERVFHTLTSG